MLDHRAQVFGERERVLVATRAVPFEGGEHYDREVRRQRRCKSPRIDRLVRQDRAVERLARARLERPAQGEALVEHHAEGIHVALRVHLAALALDLLGSHVRRCSAHFARARERLLVARDVSCETKVHDDRLSVEPDHDVGGLDVAMDDSLRVSSVRSRDLLDQASRQRSALATRALRAARARPPRVVPLESPEVGTRVLKPPPSHASPCPRASRLPVDAWR